VTDRMTEAMKTHIHVIGDIQLSPVQMRTQAPNLVSCKINSWWYMKVQILRQVRQRCNDAYNSCSDAYNSITYKSLMFPLSLCFFLCVQRYFRMVQYLFP
jgi:hypothetical protein